MLAFGRIVCDKRPERRGNSGIFASQIWADDLPAVASIASRKQDVRRQIKNMRISRGKNQRRGAVETIFPGTQNDRRDIARLPGVAVEHRRLAAINQIGMQRIGRYVTVFFHANGGPVAKSDFAEVAAAGGADRAAFLLAAIDPIGKLVIGDDVIELRGRLVIPGTPGLAAIHADGRALVESDGDDVGVFGIDPDRVVVVASGSTFYGGEIFPPIGRTIGRGVGDINLIFISRIDAHAAKIIAAPVDTLLVVHLLPAFAGVVGAVDAAALFRIDPGIHAVGVAWRYRGANAADAFGLAGQSFGELAPVIAAVG